MELPVKVAFTPAARALMECSDEPPTSWLAYQTPGAAGFDFRGLEDVMLQPGAEAKIPTGIRMEIPRGYALLVCSRSGLAAQGVIVRNSLILPGLVVSNDPGIVDADGRGEIEVLLYNQSRTQSISLKRGDRIAQGVIVPVMRAQFVFGEELDHTKRGDGSFGHTGL